MSSQPDEPPPSMGGRRVVVTRAAGRSDSLLIALQDAGAIPLVVPLLAIEKLAADADMLADAVWVSAATGGIAVFTSATTVDLASPALATLARSDTTTMAIGDATRAALSERQVGNVVVASSPVAEAVRDDLLRHDLSGRRVWLPRAKGARNVIAQPLREAGAAVRDRIVYRTVMPPRAAEQLAGALARGIDAIVVTSASAVEHLMEAAPSAHALDRLVVACIGPVTADAARAAGLDVIVAATPAPAAIVAALTERFEDSAR